MRGYLLFPCFRDLAFVTHIERFEVTTVRVKENIKVGLQIISMPVRESFDFIRETFWDAFQTGPAWSLGFSDRQERPRMETALWTPETMLQKDRSRSRSKMFPDVHAVHETSSRLERHSRYIVVNWHFSLKNKRYYGRTFGTADKYVPHFRK